MDANTYQETYISEWTGLLIHGDWDKAKGACTGMIDWACKKDRKLHDDLGVMSEDSLRLKATIVYNSDCLKSITVCLCKSPLGLSRQQRQQQQQYAWRREFRGSRGDGAQRV